MTNDITDPVVLATIVQTAVLTLTLIIFTMSFRSQEKVNREAAYERIMDDYTDAIRMLVEKPELSRLQNEMTRATPGSGLAPMTVEENTARNFVMLLYGL